MDQKIVRKNNYNYEDNMQLIQLARNGEPGALDRLVEMNLPLVASIVKNFLIGDMSMMIYSKSVVLVS